MMVYYEGKFWDLGICDLEHKEYLYSKEKRQLCWYSDGMWGKLPNVWVYEDWRKSLNCREAFIKTKLVEKMYDNYDVIGKYIVLKDVE